MSITTIVNAVAAVAGMKKSYDAINAPHVTDDMRKKGLVKYAAANADSIVEFTRVARCEPIGMIDHTIILNPVLPDLMSTLTHIYAVMYSQAFSLAINATINDIEVLRTLNAINPKRDMKRAIYGFESRSLRLPKYTNGVSLESGGYNKGDSYDHQMTLKLKTPQHNNDGSRTVSVESGRPQQPKHANSVDIDGVSKFHPNLTTGTNFNVKVQADNRTVEIPITMRIMANSIHSDNIISILEAGVVNRTAKERWRGWRSGELSFWSDLVLCKDILKADRANLIKDKTGLYTEITKRRGDNTMVGFTTGSPSISQVSNILVVSQSTIDEFERVSLKRITNNKVRETLFNATQVMILAIVDPDMETVTLYYHDISVPTTVTFKELKSNSKKGTMDPMEVLKAYQMGNGIRL